MKVTLKTDVKVVVELTEEEAEMIVYCLNVAIVTANEGHTDVTEEQEEFFRNIRCDIETRLGERHDRNV